MDALVALGWPVAFAYAAWRWARVADRALDQRADLARPVLPPVPEEAEVPNDLVALALTHREPWAQEDTLKAMRERYAELKDWQKVRFAFGIGSLDA